jgi:hypothetical protein
MSESLSWVTARPSSSTHAAAPGDALLQWMSEWHRRASQVRAPPPLPGQVERTGQPGPGAGPVDPQVRRTSQSSRFTAPMGEQVE